MKTKYINTFLLIIFMALHFIGFSQERVNFEHKKINKFIKKTYRIENFILEEIKNKESFLNGKLFKVMSNIDSSQIVYIGRVNCCRMGGCSINKSSTEGSFEYFDYIIAFDERKRIVKIKIYNYQATHGQEITAKSWLKQFRYKENQGVFKVNKNVDAISGATISVYAITDDVNMVNEHLKKILLK